MRPLPILASTDYSRLLKIIRSARLDRRIPVESLETLEAELARAVVVDAAELPGDVVAMHTTVWFRELDSVEVEKYTLVYPTEADVARDRLSVFAPIGAALLGYRVGDIVEWRVPSGTTRLEIVEVKRAGSDRPVDEAAVSA